MLKLINGTYSAGMSDFSMPWVDVRDVALAHVEAALRPEAEGRFILTAKVASIFEVIDEIRDGVTHATKLPRMKSPKWMAYLFAPLFGLSWKYVSRNVGISMELDNRRSIEHLGIDYRSLRATMSDHVDQLVADGLYRP